MGSSAMVVDTVSNYFTLPSGTSGITLQTADKTENGWATPVPATGVTPIISGQTLTVTGFDFDANYVSATARGDNNDFYGRKLIITFNVTPNYNEIDSETALIAQSNGLISTNSGLAEVADSSGTAVATHDSPTIQARKVTYMVDGVEAKTIYRLPESSVTVDPEPEKEGHNFSGWSRTGTFTMPSADVVIEGTFTPNEHKVSYVYSGVTPAAADLPALPQTVNNVAYGTTVAVDTTVVAGRDYGGYIFNGWEPLNTAVTVTGGTFTMPDDDVVLKGSFTARSNTPYIIEHYIETLTDNQYMIKEVENGAGETGSKATALAKYYEGFTYSHGDANAASYETTPDTVSATISGSGTLTFRLYYDRNEYKVSYAFSGDIPPRERKTGSSGRSYL